MRNFIGSFLIVFAAFISFLRNMLFFALTLGFVMGILMITILSFFELLGHISSGVYLTPFVLFEKPIWDVVVVVIGGATMWLGVTKLFEGDKKARSNKTKNKEYLF